MKRVPLILALVTAAASFSYADEAVISKSLGPLTAVEVSVSPTLTCPQPFPTNDMQGNAIVECSGLRVPAPANVVGEVRSGSNTFTTPYAKVDVRSGLEWITIDIYTSDVNTANEAIDYLNQRHISIQYLGGAVNQK